MVAVHHTKQKIASVAARRVCAVSLLMPFKGSATLLSGHPRWCFVFSVARLDIRRLCYSLGKGSGRTGGQTVDTKKDAKERWEEAYSKNPERDAEFSTMSGIPIKPLYTPEDVEDSYDEKLGYPGE